MASINTGRSPLERSGISTGTAEGSFSAPRPFTAKTRVYAFSSRASASSAGSARLSSSRCSAKATGHDRTRG